jgi:hypothetical protein
MEWLEEFTFASVERASAVSSNDGLCWLAERRNRGFAGANAGHCKRKREEGSE